MCYDVCSDEPSRLVLISPFFSILLLFSFFCTLSTIYVINRRGTCRDLADNRVFFQHPDLIRLLGIHETVMQLMVNTLNKAEQESAATENAMSAIDSQKRSSSLSQLPTEVASAEPAKVTI